jgi:hypothetical protein
MLQGRILEASVISCLFIVESNDRAQGWVGKFTCHYGQLVDESDSCAEL